MIDATGERYAIVVVAAAEPSGGVLCLRFCDGTRAVLRTDHPDYEIMVHSIRWSIEDGRPVGIVIEATGEVVDLRRADESTLRWVRPDEEDPRYLDVALWGFSPACCLLYDHPEFERIRTTLAEALASGREVWFATRSELFESNTGLCHNLMDARPSGAVVGAYAALRARQAAGTEANGPAKGAVAGSQVSSSRT
jgi:hypothetical protein